jgi:hypothetical protein
MTALWSADQRSGKTLDRVMEDEVGWQRLKRHFVLSMTKLSPLSACAEHLADTFLGL